VTPSVSVVIRAWRREWLRDAIVSVLSQTHRDLELVVYDDAGTLEDVARAVHDPRVRYVRADHSYKASGRFRAAVSHCRGRVIGVLDDDDRYEPAFIAQLLPVFDQDPKAGIVFCRTTWLANGYLFRPRDRRPAGTQAEVVFDMLSTGWTVSPSLMLIRRDALAEIDRSPAMPDGVSPDVFLNMRVALAGWRHVLVDAPLVVCRWHPNQLSRSFPEGNDAAVRTWQAIHFDDARLAALGQRRLARALVARAFGHLRVRDLVRAREDLRDAKEASARSARWLRSILKVAAMSRTTARLSTTPGLWLSGRGPGRMPPRRIGG
jgi:glycosyltransferase involved in cell wall biosynthesis